MNNITIKKFLLENIFINKLQHFIILHNNRLSPKKCTHCKFINIFGTNGNVNSNLMSSM